MSFTFHYVSILIDAELADIRVGAEFTFHYVSILIKTSIDLHLPDYVYIPLCLYFNFFENRIRVENNCLYIPLCLYFNLLLLLSSLSFRALHSIMSLF